MKPGEVALIDANVVYTSANIAKKAVWLVLFVFVVLGATSAVSVSGQHNCHKKREILTDSWGIISDGDGNYLESSHCEWLITANSSFNYIHLKFTKIDTECAFDFVHVFDGDSYNSTLLGSFSGTTLPPMQIARSGNMLVMLFSDVDYALKGFEAEYSSTECPFNCSLRGVCTNGTCECEHMWAGEGCETALCPDDCGYSQNRGTCEPFPEPPRCNCFPGFTGYGCSLGSNDTAGNAWHVVAPEGGGVTGLPARMGHAGAFLPFWDRFYVHGGFTLNEVLGDLHVYSMDANRWEAVLPNEEHERTVCTGDLEYWGPCPRYGHAAAAYGDGIALYGGLLANGSLSNELWFYSIVTNTWSVQAAKSILRPPPLTRHSLTVVDEYQLYLFGGNLENGSFSSLMFRINLKEGEHAQWERVRPLGGLESDRRLAGHSAVFHAESRSVVVYGGLFVSMARVSKLSDQIHVFNVDNRYWSRVHYGNSRGESHVPIERAFHSANVIGNYMVVFGGYSHDHAREERCYDNRLYFYHLGCHAWTKVEAFHEDFPGNAFPIPQGLYSHVTGVRGGNTLFIVGGFSGSVRGHFLSYIVPFTIAPPSSFPRSSQSLCSNHKFRESCRANPECGWCHVAEGNSSCLDRWETKSCDQSLETTACPGICPHLRDCQSCLAHSEWFQPKPESAPGMANLRSCTWRVQRRICYSQDDTRIINSTSPVVGWWGRNFTDVNAIEECRIKDFPPGITLLKYYHPPNWTSPDEVSIVNSTSQSLTLYPQYTSKREARGSFITRFFGFLHPVCNLSKNISHLKMCLKLTKARGILRISTNGSPENLEVVANFSTMYNSGPPSSCEAKRAKNKPLFPNASISDRYLMDFKVHDIEFGNLSAVDLTWNGCPDYAKHLTIEFLEPFSNGSCYSYTGCLQCLSDALCGWCETSSSCIPRLPHSDEEIGSSCVDGSHNRYLVTNAEDCFSCSSNVYCQDCAKNPQCEWLIPETYCVRRGRFNGTVRNASLCPAPCHELADCKSCLSSENHCAWCEGDHKCFAFNTYSPSYHHGICNRWIEQEPFTESLDDLCHTCDHHRTCKDCLGTFGCGWCFSDHNPLLGVCTSGDFRGPSDGLCRTFVSTAYNLSEAEPTDWTYGICPDVEECTMGLHNCHADATCTNTFDSYICTCNRGFRGDGNETCSQTCYENCVHGHCSESHNYSCICDLGWTGADCSENCNCNNHSTCVMGIGICDECHNWTHGKYCENCKVGSFGNATDILGCQKCNCNGHGDPSKGYCDVMTGVCYCRDSTEGDNCQYCQDGYYGNPRNGSQCYRKCDARVLITDAVSGGLGAQPGGVQGETCLWILTAQPKLELTNLHGEMSSTTIVLTIEPNMRVRCNDNFVYVYDGLPIFIASNMRANPEAGALGAFCTMESKQSFVVEAHSGVMTVFYQRDDPNQGFNASYEIRKCPDRCKPNRTCVDGECICEEGFAGRDCELEVCPNNCSFTTQKSGHCNLDFGHCECDKQHGGLDCSHKISPKEILLTSLVDVQRASPASMELLNVLPRMGHTMVADHRETLWVFGGWSITRGVLDDVLEYDTRSGSWQETNIKAQPQQGIHSQPVGRYFHAAAYVNAGHKMYVYGGFTASGEHKVLGDFWMFSIISKRWSFAPTTSRTPPALAGHTLTNRAESSLMLIGGFDMQHGFSEKVYEYSLASGQWSALNMSGGYPVGIYGHTTVYHAPSESFYVYGGVLYKINKTMVSRELYAFHYPSRKWTVLPMHEEVNLLSRSRSLPSPRYLHSAVVSSEYMLVMGGQSDSGGFVSQIHAYVFDCNMWVDVLGEGTKVIGDKFVPALGMAAAAVESSFYVFGGFAGTSIGNLMKLDIPSDLCSVYHTREACQRKFGCSFCSLFRQDGFNSTYCYTNKYEVPPSCHSSKGTSEFSHGTVCSKDWIERRNCYRHSTCSECLASWPVHPTAKNVCQWCPYCGRCIRIGGSCEDEKNCSSKHLPAIKDVSACPERQCSSSDCEKCKDIGNCIWTRQMLKSTELWRTAINKPDNNWNCFMKVMLTAFNFTVVSMPPKACPPRCTQLKDCKTCLSSVGAEGGWHECRWSESLKECISPSYQHLRCAGGICGKVQGSCPRPCVEFTQCSHCLSQPHCGWCALNHTSLNGWGKCMEGGLEGPSSGLCKPNNVTLVIESSAANVSLWINYTEGVPTWAYLSCPPENECLNNHHTCDKKSELCVDTMEGFECRCREGYVLENKRCKPVCHKGCANGTCTEPNVCVCHFGYVGENCSIHCQCNGHSNCKGVDQLDVCLECQNNTQGKQCEKCKPLFVGDPQHNGQCIPCKVYCNGHSDVCLSSNDRANNNISGTSNNLDDNRLSELLQNVTEGPGMEAICMNCLHSTKGDRCEDCVKGYFRTSGSPQDSCRPCECNGHSDTCEAINGEGCKCENNTSSDSQCSQKGKGNSQPCWKLQCSKCNDNFMGNPTNGHQCYRTMSVDRDYCFDPRKQNIDCTTLTPLYQGRTVFFAIHPKYMNVDIRVIVDVTKGGVDFFFSPKDDTFVVDVNRTSGFHEVSIDAKYGIELSEGVRVPLGGGVVHESKRRRSIDTFKRISEFDSPEISVNVSGSSQFKVRETYADGLKKFVTITDPYDFLVVRNLHHRLVITLPQAVHDLRNTRFFVVLHGIGGSSEEDSESFGTLFFRQDQPRIDLFVFFSVFFSCFFLFLAVCVVMWKVKQAVDLRRARQRHAVEMEHMASRPFAKSLVIIEEDSEDADFYAYSPSYISRKQAKGTGGGVVKYAGNHHHHNHHHHHHHHHGGRDSPKFLSSQNADDKYCVRPVAVEPTDDGVAAVDTFFFQLPGGDSAPVRLSLGSALVLMRVYPNTYSSLKACMRRRVSHHSQ